MSDSSGDTLGERLVRTLARRTSRRSLLTRLGAILVVAPSLPLLPVSRASAAEQRPGDQSEQMRLLAALCD
jgi:methylamine dehydrogenase light chain